MAVPDDSGENAAALFKSGWYCAEAVLLVSARKLGIESTHLPAIATGFCSGVGQTCGMCGAVSGAVMGLGLAFGRERSDQSVHQTYGAVKTLIERFRSEFGSTSCHELLNCDLGTPEGQATFRQGQLMTTKCHIYTQRAATLCVELIDQSAAGA